VRRINVIDSAFLYLESRQTPMHVGGMSLFEFPEGTEPQEFMAGLDELYRSFEELKEPFGEHVATGLLGPLGPKYWKQDDNLDLGYHVRHSALPKPGRYRELFSLVSRLHSTLLDRNRPLWEVNLIEGLQDRRFAVYAKYHHAAVDGIAALRMTESILSADPETRVDYSPLSREAHENFKKRRAGRRKRKAEVPLDDSAFKQVSDVLSEAFGLTGKSLEIAKAYAGTWLGMGGNLSVPWYRVPRSALNRQVGGARRFVAQTWKAERLETIRQAVGCTSNDVVLAMCSGALRRYLLNHGELPERSLRAMVPVSVRTSEDFDSSNAVSTITANLGTRHADPEQRMETIMNSTRAGKALLEGLSSVQASLYAGVVHSPMLLAGLLGVGDRFPAFSTIISNVPGPREKQYWNGAPLLGTYPASAVFHGFALNITLISYHDQLDFGIIACRRSVPQVQRMIDYMEEALVELEAMVDA